MEQFKEWWESITQREQQLAIASAVVIGIATLYWGIWTPLTDQLAESKKQLTRAETTLSWTQEKATLLLQAGAGKPQARRGNLTQILNSSARKSGITFSRIVNKNDKIEVWITNVEFESFLKWLTTLSNQYGVSVLNADLAKTNQKGYIKVNRLLLSH
ncbi:type II secretion system protein M [Psychromonas sp. Urea-02u-13]|uniref:type II secretion system protein M n=1 Tax=Psychromonas sp. Urea-02u-13 TaxID=2058326 RepID=UPI000C33D608|nr:type II secretion system protein M [Psychromonas sp. Urea-02u-13]PKG40072.1 type II secretion system protein M [Psychromonas sp. Urea-02u-13]